MRPMRGPVLCLVSAAAFGTLGIFGRLATDAGASIASTLFVRFGVAAAAVLDPAAGSWAAGAGSAGCRGMSS